MNADPPYGETSLTWDRWPDGWPTAVLRVLKPTGSTARRTRRQRLAIGELFP